VNIQIVIGCFFIVLGGIYGFAASRDYMTAERKVTPAVKTRRRIAVIFAVVGLVLIGWRIAVK
jgi:hypothetical protein